MRLWPSSVELIGGNVPVWVGTVSQLYVEHDIPLLAYLRTATDFDGPMQRLYSTLTGLAGIATAQRSREISGTHPHWSGNVLLAWETVLTKGH
jgi:hypothetical protein